MSDLARPIIDWYTAHARDLPWRAADASPWAVLVSELMLQQTPVARVLPAYAAWLSRWPSPADLAAATPGDAVRMWGKLGYPRRALRLHACAVAIVDGYGGEVPDDLAALLSLPGVGDYTARAVATFAFRQRHPVVDTNVRRVIARAVGGQGEAGGRATTRDLAAVATLLPTDAADAARFQHRCDGTRRAGVRRQDTPVRPMPDPGALRVARGGVTGVRGCALCAPQKFTGTDRQVRGLLMDVLRGTGDPVPKSALDLVWPDAAQRERALTSLVTDGLAHVHTDGRYALP